MANKTITTDTDMESLIATGLLDGQNITINSGALLTCTEKPSVLIGKIIINEGELLVDGLNISAGNSINFIGEGGNAAYDETITIAGQGKLTVTGDWYSIGTTNGTDSQSIDLSSATGSDYWDGDNHIGWIPMIQIETGRRIDFDTITGIAPEAGDWVYLSSNRSVMGKIKEVFANYLVVWYLTGTFADNDAIQVRKVVDNFGPDLQVSWTAEVNNASGDIKEAGVYQEFGNSRSGGISYISAFHHGVGGFVFDHAWQATSLTMGSAAGSVGGFRPPNGCDIRIPNVLFGSAGTVDYAANNLTDTGDNTETNWYQLEYSAGGTVDLSVCNFGNMLTLDTQAFAFDAAFVGFTVGGGSNIAGSKTTFDHCVVVADPLNRSLSGVRYAFGCQDNVNGTEITFCLNIQPETDRRALGAETSIGVTIKDCIGSLAGQGAGISTTNTDTYKFSKCDTVVFENNVNIGCDNSQSGNALSVATTPSFHGKMFLYSATQDETEQTQEKNLVNISATSINGSLIGIEQIGAGSPGNNLVNLADTGFFKLRAFGMIDDKVGFGSDGEYAVAIGGLCNDIDVARMWKDLGITEEFILTPTTCKNILVQNCSGKYASEIQASGGDNIRFKGLHGGSGNPGSGTGWEDGLPASYGNSFHDGFRSDTVGTLACLMITPSALNDETNITAGNPLFFKDGDLNMKNGDIIEFEMGYFAKGHTGFSGTYTATTGSSGWNANEWNNVTLDFQWMLDGGSWSGSWLDVRTPANWTGISGAIEAGFKLKFRFTATGTRNDMSMLLIDTTTTLTDQKDNFYPIDQNDVTITITVLDDATGLPIESANVQLYDTSDYSTVILSGTTNASGVVSAPYNYLTDVLVEGWVRQTDLASFDYVSKNISGAITLSGLTLSIRLSRI